MGSVHVHNTPKTKVEIHKNLLTQVGIFEKMMFFWFLIMRMKKNLKYRRLFARPSCIMLFAKIQIFGNHGKCKFESMKRPKWSPKILKSCVMIRIAWFLSQILDLFLPHTLQIMKKTCFLDFWRFRIIFSR